MIDLLTKRVPLEKYSAVFFLLLVSFPYRYFGSSLSVAFLMMISLPFLVIKPRLNGCQIYFILFFWYFSVLVFSLFKGGWSEYILSQSNHFFQFFVFFYFMVLVFRSYDFYRLLKVGVKFWYLPVAVLIFSIFSNYGGGYSSFGLYPFADLNIFFIFVMVLFVSKELNFYLKLLLSTLVLFLMLYISSRGTMIIFSIVLVYFIWLNITRIQLYIVSLIIILAPMALAICLDYNQLDEVYAVDVNTGIRIEFLRAGMLQIDMDFLTGQGFGGPYRDFDYESYISHPILSDEIDLNIISNHNSFFDTVLRLGLVFAFMFFYYFVYNISRKPSKLEGFLVISVTIGLSVDAWFENQLQLVLFAFCASVLFYIRGGGDNEL